MGGVHVQSKWREVACSPMPKTSGRPKIMALDEAPDIAVMETMQALKMYSSAIGPYHQKTVNTDRRII